VRDQERPLPATGAVHERVRVSGSLRVDGAAIHYEVWGQGPAIVFAHGLGGSHVSWWQQVSHFSRRYTCVSFAHRGFASSSMDFGQPDPQMYAQDLAALVDHLELTQAHLVGQSMGGWTVLEYSLRHPGRVKSLVLSSTTGSIDPALVDGFDHDELAIWRHNSMKSANHCRLVSAHPAAGLRMASEQPAMHLLYQHIDEMSPHLDKEALRARLQAMRIRTPAGLAATGIPLLLVSPQEDIVIPPIALRSLAKAVPGAKLAELACTGHSPYFENAKAFNDCLDAFFSGL
jgi:3-oxoadipate enol-lactonase